MGELAALAASVCWAVASILFTRLGKSASAEALNFAKCSIAGVLAALTVLALSRGVLPEVSTEGLTWLALSALVGLSIGDTALFAAFARVGPRRSLALTALAPPTAAVLAAITPLDEPLTLTMTIGMGITLVGVVWVVLERSEEGGGKVDRLGLIFALIAALCQGSGNVLTKLGGDGLDAMTVSALRLAFGALFLGGAMLFRGGFSGAWRTASSLLRPRKRFGLVVIATLIGTYLGVWLQVAGLLHADVGVAATLSALSPIFILPLAYFLLRERFSVRAALGAVVAVVGVAVLFLF